MSAAQRRKPAGGVVAIQMARRQAQLSDEDYRTILQAQGGAASSKDLDAAGQQRVLSYIQRTYGLLPAPAAKKPFGQPEKIVWLWGKIDKAGGLHDSSQAALLRFIARTAGIDVSHPKLLPVAEAAKVIEALKAMLVRAERAAKSAGAGKQ